MDWDDSADTLLEYDDVAAWGEVEYGEFQLRKPNSRPRGPAVCPPRAATELALDGDRIELIAVSPSGRNLCCRVPHTDGHVILITPRPWPAVPGEIVNARIDRMWRRAGWLRAAGEIEAQRLDIPALELAPLELSPESLWHPADVFDPEHEFVPKWALHIVARGPRTSFELENVLPGADPDDEWDSPIPSAYHLRDPYLKAYARKTLYQLLQADLRCLDAHAHLGDCELDRRPERALRHYEVGARIGELSVGAAFDGVLRWHTPGNRPFLHCLNGLGRCLWRLGRRAEAAAVFERLIWLDPSDEVGARFFLEYA